MAEIDTSPIHMGIRRGGGIAQSDLARFCCFAYKGSLSLPVEVSLPGRANTDLLRRQTL